MWPIDKLQVVIDCLSQTENNSVVVTDDGSDEWSVASSAYEIALPYLIENGNWNFATLVATLTASATAPTDPAFDTAYAKPPDLLHLIWVRLGDTPIDYQLLNNQIVILRRGSAAALTVKYVRQPTPDQVTPTFMMALRAFVMSGIYRGLNGVATDADRMWAAGEAFLKQARTRSDQEQPKRAVFRSRVISARLFQRG